MNKVRSIIFTALILAVVCVFYINISSVVKAAEGDVTSTPDPSQVEPAATETPGPSASPAMAVSFAQTRVTNLRMTGEPKKDEITIAWNEVPVPEIVVGENPEDTPFKPDKIMYEIWNENKFTNGYEVIGETDETTFLIDGTVINGLKSGTGLSIIARAYYVDENDQKVYGSFSDKLIAATKPDDVEEFVVEGRYSTKVVLSWKIVSDDASYMILRKNEGGKEYQTVASVDANTYTDATVKASTGYTYKIYAYIKNTEVRSDNELEVSTSTCPAPANISYTKGGDGRLKFRWSNKITCDGYIVFLMDATGVYVEFIRPGNVTSKEYILTGLKRETEYHCKIVPYRNYEGVEYSSIDEATEIILKTSGQVLTSTNASVFKSKTKLKKSSLMKTYKAFSTAVVYSKTLIMPGLNGANINYFKIDTMVNQAICFAGKYMLISAYDLSGNENSVIYVINSKTMKYVCTIVLPSKHHVGGMAYDGTNIWVSNGRAISCITMSDVKAAVASKLDTYPISAYKAKCEVASTASFITFYKDRLWIGEHNERSSVYMYAYTINGKGTATPTLTLANKMKIPSRTQDVLFLSSGKMIISRSNQVSAKKSAYYISEMSLYKPGKIKKSGTIKKNSCKGKLTMPPMLEGIAYKSGYLYTTYESACISSCPSKLDRICALKFKKIKWK